MWLCSDNPKNSPSHGCKKAILERLHINVNISFSLYKIIKSSSGELDVGIVELDRKQKEPKDWINVCRDNFAALKETDIIGNQAQFSWMFVYLLKSPYFLWVSALVNNFHS